MLNLKAKIQVEIPIKNDLSDDGMPLNVGSFKLKSKDGQRNYILDSSESDFTNPQSEGDILELTAECYLDLETFPLSKEDDNLYNITEEDLANDNCIAEFYLSDVDCIDGENCFDYDNAAATVFITNIDTGKEYILPVFLER
jgi:hypothetical protein